MLSATPLLPEPGSKAYQDIKWFKGIDSLRFILALIVLLSHFNNPFVALSKTSDYSFVRFIGYFLENAFNGTAAVIAFFVISGFVIHYPNKNGIKNVKTFWIKRFIRILIPLVIIFLAGIKFNHPDKSVVWSLICELIYYAIYPLLFKVKQSWRTKFIVTYIIAMGVIALGAHHDILSLVKQTEVNYQSYYWQMGIVLTWLVGLPVWLLGVLIAEHIDQPRTTSFNSIMFYRIAIFILSSLLAAARSYLYVSYIISMNIFAVLIYFWIQNEIVYFKNRQPNRVLEKLGKFSYSLYLCHPFIYFILGAYISMSINTYPLLIGLTIMISYIFYLAVEKPAHLLAIRLSRNFDNKVAVQ